MEQAINTNNSYIQLTKQANATISHFSLPARRQAQNETTKTERHERTASKHETDRAKNDTIKDKTINDKQYETNEYQARTARYNGTKINNKQYETQGGKQERHERLNEALINQAICRYE